LLFRAKSCKLEEIGKIYNKYLIKVMEVMMYKKTYLLPIAVIVIILLLTSLACSLPFPGGDDGDEGSVGSSVEFEGDNDSDSDDADDMEDNDADGDHESEDSDYEDDDSDTGSGDSGGESDAPFPMADDADILLQDDRSATYGTKLSISETIDFYRAEFDKLGFTERDLLTAITDDSFSMVFDGHSSGQAILVQGTDFGESTNISIQFQDI
jgi:hypothetical protein